MSKEQRINYNRIINGQYELEEQVSEGGYGYIYKGIDLKNKNKEIAIKIQKANLIEDQLLKEYQIYKKLGKCQVKNNNYQKQEKNLNQKILISQGSLDSESLESTNSCKKGFTGKYFFGESHVSNKINGDIKNSEIDEIIEEQSSICNNQNDETQESSQQQQLSVFQNSCQEQQNQLSNHEQLQKKYQMINCDSQIELENQNTQKNHQQFNKKHQQQKKKNQFQVYEFSRDSETGEEFLVMDFLQGYNLKQQQALESDNKFDQIDVAKIAVKLLKQLQHIHSKGIIHCDIKPENILVKKNEKCHDDFINTNDDELELELIDFGLSQYYKNEQGTHVPFEIMPNIQGTIKYLSLCASMGYQQSRRDDLESLGYILSYMLNGYLPWERKSFHAQLTFSDKQEEQIYYAQRTEQIKLGTQSQDLFENCDQCFVDYLDYCKNLDFDESPNYEYLINLFQNYLNQYFNYSNQHSSTSLFCVDIISEQIEYEDNQTDVSTINELQDNDIKYFDSEIKLDNKNQEQHISYQIYNKQSYQKKKQYSLGDLNINKQKNKCIQQDTFISNFDKKEIENEDSQQQQKDLDNKNKMKNSITMISSYQIRNNERQQQQ